MTLQMVLEWLLSSALLIGAVLVLRWVLGRRVSAGLRYALWAVVLVRLLVPVPLFSSPIAGARLVPTQQINAALRANASNAPVSDANVPAADGNLPAPDGAAPAQPDGEPLPPGVRSRQTMPDGSTVTVQDNGIILMTSPDPTKDITRIPFPTSHGRFALLSWIWTVGAAAAALVLLFSNLCFFAELQERRVPLEGADCRLPVYVADGLPSPCLFGVFRPSVYVTPGAAADPARLRHVLTHEYTHFRHGDHIWALLRCAALTVHWWNPLVWLAAALSRQDCELACDEGALKHLGEAERIPYGRTLLALLTEKARPADLLRCSTAMTGGKRRLTERITRIAKRPRRWLWATAAVLLAVVLACACAFGTAPETQSASDAEKALANSSSAAPNETLPIGSDGSQSGNADGGPAQSAALAPRIDLGMTFASEDAPALDALDTSFIPRGYQSPGDRRSGTLRLPTPVARAGRYVFVNTETADGSFAIARYDLENRRAAGELPSLSGYGDGNILVLSEDRLVTSCCDSFNENGCRMTVLLLDFAAGERTVLFEQMTGLVGMNFARLDADSFACRYTNLDGGESVGVYENGALAEVYRTGVDERLFAIDASDGGVDLLTRREKTWHYIHIDRAGQVLRDDALACFDTYTGEDITADRLTVCGDWMVIKFYSAGGHLPFAALNWDGSAWWPTPMAGTVYPCWPLTEEPVSGRYLVFSTFPDGAAYDQPIRSADIAILDTETRTWTMSKLLDNDGGEVTVVCGEDGRILFTDTRSEAVSEWYEWEII